MNAALLIGSWIVNIGPWGEKPMSLSDFIKMIVEMGYSGFAPGGFGTHVDPKIYKPGSWQLDELKAKVKTHDLKLGFMAANLWGFTWVTSSNRQQTIADLNIAFEEACVTAKDLGCPGIRIDTLHHFSIVTPGEHDSLFKQTVALIKELCKIAAKYGLKVAIEAEPCWMFINTISGVEALVKAVDEPNCGIQYDSAHFEVIRRYEAQALTQVAAIQRLSPYIIDAHLGDNPGGAIHEGGGGHGPTGVHVTLGRGTVRLSETARALDACPNLGACRTLDLCFTPTADTNQFVESLVVMKGLYPKHHTPTAA